MNRAEEKLKSMITDTEYKAINEYIRAYATDSAEVVYEDAHNILNEWAQNKAISLAPMFKDSLILSKKATYEIGEESYDAIIRLCDHSSFCSKIYDFIFSLRPYHIRQTLNVTNLPLTEEHRYNNMADVINALISAENLFENKVPNLNQITWVDPAVQVMEIGLPTWTHPVKVQEGARVMRVLGKIAKEMHLENEFNEFRDEHAKLANRKACNGTICLSIHPLDYMTMSDNNSDWRSCMSWKENGCYRQGTVEMMNSPMVVVAYLKDEDLDMRLVNGYKWNNKKWRSLFIVTPDVITDVKSYPYFNPNLTKIALEWIKELREASTEDKYASSVEVYRPFTRFIPKHNPNATINIKPFTNTMYCDFSETRDNYGFIKVNISPAEDTSYRINYSGACQCMACGTTRPEFSSEEALVCDDCQGNVVLCEECGCRINLNEDAYENLGDCYMCEDCYANCTTTDALTGEVIMKDDATKIYLADDTHIYKNIYFYTAPSNYSYVEMNNVASCVYSYSENRFAPSFVYVKQSELYDGAEDAFGFDVKNITEWRLREECRDPYDIVRLSSKAVVLEGAKFSDVFNHTIKLPVDNSNLIADDGDMWQFEGYNSTSVFGDSNTIFTYHTKTAAHNKFYQITKSYYIHIEPASAEVRESYKFLYERPVWKNGSPITNYIFKTGRVTA